MTTGLIDAARRVTAIATPEEQAQIGKLLAALQPRWVPQLGPQTDAYNSPADELFYGGAAGGGKTDLLLGLTFQHHRSIIFRRVYPNLKGIIDRSIELFGSPKQYNITDKVWKFADGRQVEFGAVEHEQDWENYRGRPHDLAEFDEVTEFTRFQYEALRGWVRTTKPGQRTRTVATFNPPRPGQGEWVKDKLAAWIDPKHPNPAKPGELRWFVMMGDTEVERPNGEPFTYQGELLYPWSRTFIPSRLSDNLYFEGTDYRRQLQSMPEPLRSQLLYGDMNAGTDDHEWQVIPSEWVKAAQTRWSDRSQPPVPLTNLGVDVARGGQDRTVLIPLYGTWFGEPIIRPGTETPDGMAVVELIAPLVESGGHASIDAIGVGASVVDLCVVRGIPSRAVVSSASAPVLKDKTGNFGFKNARSYGWWRLREALDPESGENVALPPGRAILSELTTPRYSVVNGKIDVESRDSIMERLGRSPDIGSAMMLAWSFRAVPTFAPIKPKGLPSFQRGGRFR